VASEGSLARIAASEESLARIAASEGSLARIAASEGSLARIAASEKSQKYAKGGYCSRHGGCRKCYSKVLWQL
jgi:hypothetical protein